MYVQFDCSDGKGTVKSPVSAQVVHQKFEFLKVDDLNGPMKKLAFNPTFFGDSQTVHAEIFNNGPLPTHFDVRGWPRLPSPPPLDVPRSAALFSPRNSRVPGGCL
jgi:hypothetical protein